MDQVAKDVMLEVAEQDQQDGLDGIQGVEGDEEVNEIMSKVRASFFKHANIESKW